MLGCSVNITITNGDPLSISVYHKGVKEKNLIAKLTSGQSTDINVDMYEKVFFFHDSSTQLMYAHVKNDRKSPNKIFKPTRNSQKIHLLILKGKYYTVCIHLIIHFWFIPKDFMPLCVQNFNAEQLSNRKKSMQMGWMGTRAIRLCSL